jgi:L-ribulose-5-phosphate 4-epimerase
MSTFDTLKEEACKANRALPATGLVVQTFGNASAWNRERGVFAIKPSGVPFEDLTPERMIVVDLQLNVVEGEGRPSSDTKTHAVLYRAWPDLGGIVHTHSPHAVAWAQAVRPIPVLGTTHADLLAMDVPCTSPLAAKQIRGDYEEETGRQIVRRFRRLDHREVPMVLVANHGPFVWGGSAEEALERAVCLELIARTALLTLQIRVRTPRLPKALLRKHFARKHGPDAYYGQQ